MLPAGALSSLGVPSLLREGRMPSFLCLHQHHQFYLDTLSKGWVHNRPPQTHVRMGTQTTLIFYEGLKVILSSNICSVSFNWLSTSHATPQVWNECPWMVMLNRNVVEMAHRLGNMWHGSRTKHSTILYIWCGALLAGHPLKPPCSVTFWQELDPPLYNSLNVCTSSYKHTNSEFF